MLISIWKQHQFNTPKMTEVLDAVRGAARVSQ